jgi:hypothetical protein
MICGTRIASWSVHFRDDLGRRQREVADPQHFSQDSLGRFVRSFAEHQLRRWEDPSCSVALDAFEVESPKMIPRSLRIHPSQQDGRGLLCRGENHKRGNAETAWLLPADAEFVALKMPRKSSEPSIGSHRTWGKAPHYRAVAGERGEESRVATLYRSRARIG